MTVVLNESTLGPLTLAELLAADPNVDRRLSAHVAAAARPPGCRPVLTEAQREKDQQMRTDEERDAARWWDEQ